jgi:hypothetical protein
MDLDSDLDGLDSKVKVGGRYFSAKHAVLERNKGFKHLKVLKRDNAILPEDFIPVEASSIPAESTTTQHELEESWEDEILRRTKEFNKMTRESPHDEKIWLAFAQFQVSQFYMNIFHQAMHILYCIVDSFHSIWLSYK